MAEMITTTQAPVKKGNGNKKWIFVLVAVLAAGLLLLYSYLTNRVVPSASQTLGNTAGNLYNGGLFCENDGVIYFSNPNDDYTLYSMSTELKDFEKLYDDYARYINADENYVYYTRKNNKKENPTNSIFIFFSTGVYRIGKGGSNIKAISTDPSGSLLVYDNRLYYETYNNNKLTLYSTGLDGKDEKKLISDDTPVVSVYDNKIYYAGNLSDQNIHYINSSGGSDVAIETKAYLPIVTAEGVFYISTAQNYNICRCDTDGANNETLVDRSVSWYNMTDDGRYIFYQCDDKDNSAIYVLDRTENTTEKIADGNYKWINIAGGYCFFFDYYTERAFAYDYDEKVLNLFNPETDK